MNRLTVVLMLVIPLAGCKGTKPTEKGGPAPTEPAAPKLTADQAKALLSEAGGIAAADFEQLSKPGTTPDPSRIKSRSLSLVLMTLDPADAAKNPKFNQDFKYLGEGPPAPTRIAEAMAASKAKGYYSLLQPENITSCMVTTIGGSATGSASFEAKDLYEGNVNYSGRAVDGKWRIEEFRLPNRDITIKLDKDGLWKETSKKGPSN